MNKRRKVDLVILSLVVVGGYFAVSNAQAIGDRWFFLSYSPPENMQRLAEDAGMGEEGKKLFFRFSPVFVDAETIEGFCGEKLGCVEGTNMYILQTSGSAGYNRSIVTAAHEMLHVAYSRLPDEEKSELDSCLREQLQTMPNRSLSEKLKGYPEEEVINEAHSFIGSEVPELTTCMSAHYSNYFDDRAKSVRAYGLSPEGGS